MTANDAALVLPHDAAHIVLAQKGAGIGAVDELPAGLVIPRHAAYIGAAFYIPVKRAVYEPAAVAPHQSADGVLPVAGGDGAADGEILNDGYNGGENRT